NNADGGFPGVAGSWALAWGAGDRLVFASEQTGWIGMYVVSAQGGDATRLTPTGCEVYDVAPSPERDALLYASNCGDIDRRHVQRVSLDGGAPADVTTGAGLEWLPQPLADGAVAVLRSDARRPAAPAILGQEAPVM